MFRMVVGFRAVDGSNASPVAHATVLCGAPPPSPPELPAARPERLATLALTVLWIGSTAVPAATAPRRRRPATTTTTTTTSPRSDHRRRMGPQGRRRRAALRQRPGRRQNHPGRSHRSSSSFSSTADGEGGGEFVQQGSLIKIERVGPLLYFNAPTKFWATHATAAQTKTYGGKWIEFSAVDPRFTSFDQFLDAADLVVAAFQGHTAPLTVGRPTTFAGHKVVVVKDTVTNKGKTSTGLMYIAAKGPALVYKIVDDTPGDVSTVVFDHYGKGATLTVPPNAINLS